MMTKSIVGLIGAAGVSSTTFVLLNKGGSGTGTGDGAVDTSSLGNGVTHLSGSGAQVTGPGANPSSQPAAPKATSKLQKLYETVNEFKQKMKDSPCVRDVFKMSESWDVTKGSEIQEGSELGGGGAFFKKDREVEPFQSCLIINWRKTKVNSGNKWTGKFAWLWTFIRGDEGFINFNIAEPSDEDGKLKFTGVFYLVGQENGKWEIKYKKEVDKKDQDSSDKHLPKLGDGVKALQDSTGDYWGFMESSGDISNICKSADDQCTSGTTSSETKHFKWTFDKGKSNSKEIKAWTKNLEWWKSLYGLEKAWKLRDKTQDFKGSWSKANPN